jgi:hypothetical protein
MGKKRGNTMRSYDMGALIGKLFLIAELGRGNKTAGENKSKGVKNKTTRPAQRAARNHPHAIPPSYANAKCGLGPT